MSLRVTPIFLLGFLFVAVLSPQSAAASSVAFSKGLVAFSASDFQLALPLFQQARAGDPENPDPVYFLGLTYLRLDKYAEASETLKEFLEKRPGFSEAYFPYGLSLYRQKQYAEAAVWLEKAKTKNRDDPLPVFYSGLAEYYQGNGESAVSVLQTVGRMAPNSDLADAADEWIQEIQTGKAPKEEGGPAKVKKWTLRASASSYYDSNVLLDPDEEDIAGFQSNQIDAMGVGTLDLTYLLARTKRSKLYVEYSGYVSGYANIDFDFNRFNFSRNTAGINYYANLSDKIRWRLPLNFTMATLGIGRYVWIGYGENSFDVAWSPQWVTTVSGKIRRNRYYQNNLINNNQLRTGYLTNFQADQYYFFPGKKEQYIKISYEFGANFADGNDWDYRSDQVHFTFNTPLFGKFSFFTTEGIMPLRKFRHIDSVFGVRRGDFVFNSTSALSYKFNPHLSLGASYSYYMTESNITFYSYHRQVAGLTLATQW